MVKKRVKTQIKKARLVSKKNSKSNSSGKKSSHSSQQLSFKQKAADALANWAGSWTFIFFTLFFIGAWMFLNVKMLGKEFDPYPFILLNFILSTLAALQAPVILMSQNRQAERDRINAKYDYQVNRLAEREIQSIMKDIKHIKATLPMRKIKK
jgi:uncharacterized membrane protein